MDWQQQTLEYYNSDPAGFAAGTQTADMTDTHCRFIACLPPQGRILDFGCGAGRDTKAFLEAGFVVEATDGSEELCKAASEYTGIAVKQMLFGELSANEQYDGIWACASILHLPKAELADAIRKTEAALKHGGVLYASFKYGSFEGMRNGRYFTDFTEENLKEFWQSATAMQIFDMWVTNDVRPGRKDERWINILARKD